MKDPPTHGGYLIGYVEDLIDCGASPSPEGFLAWNKTAGGGLDFTSWECGTLLRMWKAYSHWLKTSTNIDTLDPTLTKEEISVINARRALAETKD